MSEDNSAIVRAIVALGHHLGLDVVAEGIETAEQRAQLTEFGVQGTGRGHPLLEAGRQRGRRSVDSAQPLPE